MLGYRKTKFKAKPKKVKTGLNIKVKKVAKPKKVKTGLNLKVTPKKKK